MRPHALVQVSLATLARYRPRQASPVSPVAMTETNVILGLGANVGDPLRTLAAALKGLPSALDVTRVSSVYRSAPVGFGDQPDFLNLVCTGTTRLQPEALLRATQSLERALGRVPTFPGGPRVVDVDLLAYGTLEMRTAALTLPHPALHERGFVLVPLAEIAAGWRHPVLGRTPAQLLATAVHAAGVERVGALPAPSLAPPARDG